MNEFEQADAFEVYITKSAMKNGNVHGYLIEFIQRWLMELASAMKRRSQFYKMHLPTELSIAWRKYKHYLSIPCVEGKGTERLSLALTFFPLFSTAFNAWLFLCGIDKGKPPLRTRNFV